jgi:hypothetical protein
VDLDEETPVAAAVTGEPPPEGGKARETGGHGTTLSAFVPIRAGLAPYRDQSVT